MAKIINPLAWNVPIVDPKTGRPTPYFKRILEDIADAKISASLIEALGGDPDEDQVVTWDDTLGDLAFKPATDVLDMIDDTHGAILYRDTDDWLALAPGADGDVLTTHGAAADPTWETPAAGGSGALTLIEAHTFDGTTATKTFSSIPGTHKDLILVFNGRSTRAGQILSTHGVRFNADSTAANYYTQFINAANATVNASANAGTVGYCAGATYPAANSVANAAAYLELTIGDYSATTFHKMFRGRNTHAEATSAAGHTIREIGGRWLNTAAVTSIEFFDVNAANFVNGSTVELWARA